MSKTLQLIGWLCVFTQFSFAQNRPTDTRWQEIRNQQPPGLRLTLTLPRHEYFQGEKIEATLNYANDDTAHKYALEVGVTGPGGVFCAEDASGHRVADPNRWVHLAIPEMIDGLSLRRDLGAWSVALPVNENVRFDRPGDYLLFAEATVVKDKNYRSPIWIVSDKIPIRIIPLPPEKEKQIIADALGKIGAGAALNSQVREGFAELNFLSTPAAREAELPFLANKTTAGLAGNGFLQAADPAKEADRILAAVKSGKLVLGQEGIYTYGTAKAFTLVHDNPVIGSSNEPTRELFAQIDDAEDKARKEIVAVQLAVSGQSGSNQAHVLFTTFAMTEPHGAFGEPDPDGGAARKALAQHQLELSSDEIEQLFENWAWWGSPDFLPLVRREANASFAHPAALIILAGLSPDEARPLVLREFNESTCRFFPADTGPGNINLISVFSAVTPMPMPEVDSILRKKFAETCSNYWPILPVIACFGSKNLLPDVLTAYRQYGKRWDGQWIDCLVSYAFRAGPGQAAAEFEQDIATHQQDGLPLLDSLQNVWTDHALPFVLWTARQDDPKLALVGIYLLQLHGDQTTIDPVIAALERLQSRKESQNDVRSSAGMILKNTRWHMTDVQKKRLIALETLPVSH